MHDYFFWAGLILLIVGAIVFVVTNFTERQTEPTKTNTTTVVFLWLGGIAAIIGAIMIAVGYMILRNKYSGKNSSVMSLNYM